MNCLVTGGAGFIGSHIVDRLLERGDSVRVLDNFSSGKKENIRHVADRIELIEGDVRDPSLVRKAVSGVDAVFHEAAISSVMKSIEDPVLNDDVNVGGTLNVLQAARAGKVNGVVFASSAAVYGNGGTVPKTEEMMPSPESPYAVSKLTGEYYCRVFAKLYGLHTVSLRYFNVFGERQDPISEYSGVISKFVSAFETGKSPVIYGDGEQSRDFVYVGDVAEANVLALTSSCAPGSVMNVGSSVSTTVNELVAELNSIFGKDYKARYQDPRPGDVRHSLSDTTLIRKTLGYLPKTKFREGIQRVVRN